MEQVATSEVKPFTKSQRKESTAKGMGQIKNGTSGNATSLKNWKAKREAQDEKTGGKRY